MVGWLAALGLGLCLSWALGELRACRAAAAEIQKLRVDLLEVQEKQDLINATYIKAWEAQEKTADALISWGQYATDRKEIIEMNKNAVSTLIRKTNGPSQNTRNP